MSRMGALVATSVRAATGRAARTWATMALLVGSMAAGVACGLHDAGRSLDADARNRAEGAKLVEIVEEVSSLADLDARTDGPWDTYETGFSDFGVVKGSLTRYFVRPGPYVGKKPGEPSFASTRGIDSRACHRVILILASGPLAKRIELNDGEDWLQGWKPIQNSLSQCGGYGSKRSIAIRVAPRFQEATPSKEARAR